MITETGSLVLKAGTIRSLAILITLLFVLPCFAAEPSPTTQPRSCTFAGKILQLGSDKPAANLALSGYVEGPNEQYDFLSLTTDEQGAFRTTVPAGSYVDIQWKESPDGSYLIDNDWRQQSNWQPISHRSVTRDVTDLVLRVKLVPATQLQGHVVDSQGHPVQGVSVYADPRLLPAITDSTGSFTLKCVPQGRDVHLFALRDSGGFMGFLAKRMLGTVAQIKYPTTNPTLTLAPCQSFDGQVLTPDGLPAAQLSFTLRPKLGHESLYQFQQSITTDAAGKFSTKRLIPNATYQAFWNSSQEENRDYDSGRATLDLSQLKPGQPIKFTAPQYLNALMGQVVNEQGNPIKDAAIFLENRQLLPQDTWNNVPFHTDAQGQFVIPRLAPGNITLHISAPGYKGRQFTSATDSIDFKATLKSPTPTCQYRFVVVDENNQPLKDASIR
ncbi:MAG TPA: carboxypeptidase-like regulatory domain-containing protein, partial [Tepidisphaeraceae bacterium]|nr:carboxypeptidase-like regulatory domain-containing protein [Tepidisphaeraceae bacterium]